MRFTYKLPLRNYAPKFVQVNVCQKVGYRRTEFHTQSIIDSFGHENHPIITAHLSGVQPCIHVRYI